MAKLPGLRIPLLPDAKYRKLGIDRPQLPPFETWTLEQQQAGRELGEILARMAVHQACRSVLRHLEIMEEEEYPKDDFQKEAARRALAELHAGKWKAGSGETFGLEDAMRWALEYIVADPLLDENE